MNQGLNALRSFIFDDRFVYSRYLLFVELTPASELGSVESQLLFMMWFIVYGRHEYVLPTVIPADIRDLITALSPERHHFLMQYVADQDGIRLAGDALRLWYYDQAVPRRSLAPFVGSSELAELRGQSPGAKGMLRDARAVTASSPAQPLGSPSTFVDRLIQLASRAENAQRIASVSIVGYHKAVLGVGEDARCLFECLCEAGIVPEFVDVSPDKLERSDQADVFLPFEAPRPTGQILIFCLPAFEMVWAMTRLCLLEPRAGQYRIGFWPWETSALPTSWKHVYDLVDEVWASTTFLEDVYSADTRKPVVGMPMHVHVDPVGHAGAFEDVLDQRFTFLNVFDFNSGIVRKNPTAAIEAFRSAFPDDVDDVRLVLKSLHASIQPGDLRSVLAAVGDDRRIVLRDMAMPKGDLCGLMARADVYVSLHRSEGFGRPIAEAMLLGTPVIATGWSGCADFLTDETGYPVRSTLRAVEKGEYAFASGEWADPDVDHAAELMRAAYENREKHTSKTVAARELIERRYGLAAVSGRVRQRLQEVTRRLPHCD